MVKLICNRFLFNVAANIRARSVPGFPQRAEREAALGFRPAVDKTRHSSTATQRDARRRPKQPGEAEPSLITFRQSLQELARQAICLVDASEPADEVQI